MIDKTCSFEVRAGKVFCTKHRKFLTKKEKNGAWSWEKHRTHKLSPLPFRHVLYTATFCEDCKVLLLDEEQ